MRTLLILSMAFLLFSCGEKPQSKASAEGVNMIGFDVVDIPGTSAQRIIKKDESGNLLEEGIVQNGQKTGTWVRYHVGNNIPRTINQYVDGVRNGVSFVFNDKGQIMETAGYLNNELHGISATYKYGKPLTQANYTTGELDGTYRTFHEGKDRGKVQKEINYKMGVQHGMYRFYNADGDISLEYEYKDGKKLSGGMVEEAK